MGGRTPKNNRETARDGSAGAVDDKNWSKATRSKKTQFSPPRNEWGRGAAVTKKGFSYTQADLAARQTLVCFLLTRNMAKNENMLSL